MHLQQRDEIPKILKDDELRFHECCKMILFNFYIIDKR